MQQINLLNDDVDESSDGFGAKHLLIAWIGFAGLLIAFTSWQGLSVWGLQNDLSQTENDVQKLRAANEAERIKRMEPNGMREQIAALQLQQSEQDQLMELLRAQQQSRGFSGYLHGLAKAHVRGLWLSEIEIVHDTGRRISLRGTTSNPSLVPKLLHNLADEHQFSGQRFEQLELTVAEENADLMHFSLISPNGDVSG